MLADREEANPPLENASMNIFDWIHSPLFLSDALRSSLFSVFSLELAPKVGRMQSSRRFWQTQAQFRVLLKVLRLQCLELVLGLYL